MIAAYILGGASLIFAILFSWIRSIKPSIYSLVLKIAASVCFILCGAFAIKEVGSSSLNLLIIAGLVMGLIGDILLDLKIMYPEQSNEYFVSGTFSFAIGHLFYFIALVMFNMQVLPANLLWNILASVGVAIVLTLGILLPSKKLGLDFGSMFWIVALYSFILTFMVAFSFSIAIFVPIFWVFASGMLLFFLSDLVLSMQYFGGKTQKSLIYINHILYYAAQILIALSILLVAF